MSIVNRMFFGIAFSLLILGQSAIPSDAKTLNISHMAAPPQHMDPFKVYGTRTQSFFRQIYGSLIDRDEKGTLIPAIATDWKYRGNGVWRLHLRTDVRFQDGSLLTTEDVKYSLERLNSPASVRPRRRDFSFIVKVKVVSSEIVDVYTKGPVPLFPARLAQFSMILPHKKVQKIGEEKFFQNPIGAGPFRLIHLDKDKALLKRHTKYYRGTPGVEQIQFHFIRDPRQRLEMLLDGKLDILPNVLPAFTKKIAAKPQVTIVKKPSLQFTYAMFDTLSKGPLQDVRVRKALAHWTDKPALIRYVEIGNGRNLATFVMPEEFGFNPNLKPYSFDNKRSKALMEEAGYSKGFTLTGVASDEVALLAKAVARQWKRLGVKLELKIVPRAEAIRLWVRTKKYQVYFFAPTNPLFDASFHLKSKLDSLHPVNRFHNDEAIKLVKKMDRLKNPEERKRVLYRLQEIVYDQVPVITFYQRVVIYGISQRIKNFIAYPDTILRLNRITVLPKSGKGRLIVQK